MWWCFFREEQLTDSGRLHSTLHEAADSFQNHARAAGDDRYFAGLFAALADVTVQDFHRSLRKGPDAVLAMDSAVAGDQVGGRLAAEALLRWRRWRELPAESVAPDRLALLAPLLGDPPVLTGDGARDLAQWRAGIVAEAGEEKVAGADPSLFGMLQLVGTPLTPEARRCFGAWGSALGAALRASTEPAHASRRDFFRRLFGGGDRQ